MQENEEYCSDELKVTLKAQTYKNDVNESDVSVRGRQTQAQANQQSAAGFFREKSFPRSTAGNCFKSTRNFHYRRWVVSRFPRRGSRVRTRREADCDTQSQFVRRNMFTAVPLLIWRRSATSISCQPTLISNRDGSQWPTTNPNVSRSQQALIWTLQLGVHAISSALLAAVRRLTSIAPMTRYSTYPPLQNWPHCADANRVFFKHGRKANADTSPSIKNSEDALTKVVHIN